MSQRRPGFTLIEMVVVLLIIALVSVATLPTIVSAISHRQVSEAARVLQAAIEGARDAAIRANAPRGIRLLPDHGVPTGALAASRIVALESAAPYAEGHITIRAAIPNASGVPGVMPPPGIAPATTIEEARYGPDGLLSAPTSWYWNVRVGDRIQIAGVGPIYTIVGPEVMANPERFINVGEPGRDTASGPYANPYELGMEYLFIVNGKDDDGDGFTDEGFDGIDNNNKNGMDRADPLEWESEPPLRLVMGERYTIFRRPYPTHDARATELPGGVVIDLTTWDTTRERSRLPVDPDSRYVDFMVRPDGQVIPQSVYSTPAKFGDMPVFHFWLAERADVHPPLASGSPRLPMPEGVIADATTTLKGDRRLVTVFPRTGLVITGAVETFSATNVDAPFADAHLGRREAR